MRAYKIEVEDGVNYEFYIHDDGKFEMVDCAVAPISIVSFRRSLQHAEEMVKLMNDESLLKMSVSKV